MSNFENVRTASEVSKAFREESPENERLYQEAGKKLDNEERARTYKSSVVKSSRENTK